VDEPEFWTRLEYRISAELARSAERGLRYYWCDGLVPDGYDLDGAEPRISGLAWCGPSGQEPWRFTLLTGRQATSRDQVNWLALLPGDRLAGWLRPDPQNKTLRIDPLSGHDDLPPPHGG
jgi:hypothetical protein